jgi:predicted nucleic acid-binding protein
MRGPVRMSAAGPQRYPQPRSRREYLDTAFAAIPVDPFAEEMAQSAAKIDADARRSGLAIPFADR